MIFIFNLLIWIFQTGVSERQHLEANIDWFELKKEQNINDLVRCHLLRDSVPDYLDSLKNIFQEFDVKHGECKIASALASQKDFIQALAILDAHLAEHPDDVLCKLQKLMIEFDQQLSWCLDPTQDQKDKLDEIKDEPHKGCVAAKGLLEMIGGFVLEDYRILSQDNRSMFVEIENQKIKPESKIFVYPNPTNDWITVQSDLKDEKYTIEIHDFTGRIIFILQTSNPTNSIDLSKYSDGIYYVKVSTLINGNQLFKIVKN